MIAGKPGRLANLLVQFAHFIAFSAEYGITVWNPSFDGYARYFAGTKENPLCRYPAPAVRLPTPQLLRTAAYRVTCMLAQHAREKHEGSSLVARINLPDYDLCTLSEPWFLRAASSSTVLFVRGWRFRDYVCLEKHADIVRSFLEPTRQVREMVTETVRRARLDCDVLVGVHIRHGDYARWQGGRYFYTTQQYADVMRQVEALFAPRTVAFLVCSDAPQDASSFSPLQVHLGAGHLVGDMYSLAGCDYIFGPPSTYNIWASFYGNVPRYGLEDIRAAVQSDAFHVSTV